MRLITFRREFATAWFRPCFWLHQPSMKKSQSAGPIPQKNMERRLRVWISLRLFLRSLVGWAVCLYEVR
jgi:hypothetical protein